MTKLEYKYDSQNQLVRVDDYDQNYTFTYSYDTNGNMEYSYKYVLGSTSTGDLRGLDTNSYDSTWSDKLTYSTKVGAITYDAIGNPLKYGNNTLSWTGRQLDSFVGTGTNIGYKYDSDGMRVSKTVNGVKSEYYYVDGKLYYEKRGSKELFYNYGNDGNLLRIRLSENGSDLYYYAACNMRGDVVALYKGDGGIKAEYKYDAWGKVLSVTDANGNEITDANNIGLLNPIRYRGYYYDAETGFYYLQSRYYDPEIGRFINADNQVSVGNDMTGMNLFAYCGNNPVNRTDSTGEAWWHWVLGAAVVVGCAIATVATAGGFAAGAAAIGMAASGISVGGAAGAFAFATVGSGVAFGTMAVHASATSRSVKEFNRKGNWGTVFGTAVGGVIGGGSAYVSSKSSSYSSTGKRTATTIKSVSKPNVLNIKYPGNDSTKCNIYGFEWRGSGTPMSGKGNFINMKTGEWLHPDLNHGPPIGPHWDYGVSGSNLTYRIFPDGSILPK